MCSLRQAWGVEQGKVGGEEEEREKEEGSEETLTLQWTLQPRQVRAASLLFCTLPIPSLAVNNRQ